MGIVVHKSSLLVPDAKAIKRRVKKATKVVKLNKTTKRKLMGRRRQEYDELIDEARIWMFAMILPTETIANGDKEIKETLDETIHELTVLLLGTKIDHSKVNRICEKIAINVLVPGLSNGTDLKPGRRYQYPHHPTWEQMRPLIDDQQISAQVLVALYKLREDFQRRYPNARTWREVRDALAELELFSGPIILNGFTREAWLDDQQMYYTEAQLGLPYMQRMTTDQKRQICTRLRSSNAEESHILESLNGHEAYALDLIVVRAGEETPRAAASIDSSQNTLDLHPAYYEEPRQSLRDVSIVIGQTCLRDVFCNVLVLLHEITHSASTLNTADHTFRYSKSEIDVIDRKFRCRPLDGNLTAGQVPARDEFSAYGLESCLALVRRDERDNTNKAEDNAENWAFYFTIRMLMLAYPEIDFLRAVRTEDPFNLPNRILQYRGGEILHHCTLFEPLRGRVPLPPLPNGGIRDRHYYDITKDYWSVISGRGDSRTLADILEVLEALQKRKEKKSDKNRRQKARLKAQGRLVRKRKAKSKTAKPNALQRVIDAVFTDLRDLWADVK